MDYNTLLSAFASCFSQQHRAIQLTCRGDFSSDYLLPLSLSGSETLSDDFAFELDILVADAEFDLFSLLGREMGVTLAGAQGTARALAGIVTQGRIIGMDANFVRARLTLRSALAVLGKKRRSRHFHDLTIPQVISQVLDEARQQNPLLMRAFTYENRLQGTYPVEPYIAQRGETDREFVLRLMAREGINFAFTHHLDGEHVYHAMTWFDRNSTLEALPTPVIRYHRSDATEEEDGIQSFNQSVSLQVAQTDLSMYTLDQPFLHQIQETTSTAGFAQQTLPKHLEQATRHLTDYQHESIDYQQADVPELQRYALLRQRYYDLSRESYQGSSTDSEMVAGGVFTLDNYPGLASRSSQDRQFVLYQVSLQAWNNIPGTLQNVAANKASIAEEVESYHNTFIAVREAVPLVPGFNVVDGGTLPLRLHKPPAPRRQLAQVVGPQGQGNIYTNDRGQIRIQLLEDREVDHPDTLGGAAYDTNSSLWVDVQVNLAGSGFGVHALPRIGTYVYIDYDNGDIDRPVCVGSVHSTQTPVTSFSGRSSPEADNALMGIRSREFDAGRGNQLVFDDTNGQIRAQLASDHADSEINLGYLGTPRSGGQNTPTGEGIELHSTASLAARAASGILLTTYARLQAASPHLERQALVTLLGQCIEQCKAISEFASEHNGLAGDFSTQQQQLDDLKSWENGSNTQQGGSAGGQPVIAMASPEAIIQSSAKGISSYAGLNQYHTALKHYHLTTGMNLLVNAGDGISQFAQSGAFKAIAHLGPIELQAQNNTLTMQSLKDMLLQSLQGDITVNSKTIKLVAEDGSYIQIGGGGVVMGSSGPFMNKTAAHQLLGSATMSVPVNPFTPGYQRTYVLQDNKTSEILDNHPYQLTLPSGKTVTGLSNAEGMTQTAYSATSQPVKLASNQPSPDKLYTLQPYGNAATDELHLELKDPQA